MKRSFLILLSGIFLSSCVMQSRLVETNDPYKNIDNVRLIQYLIAKSADRGSGLISGQDYQVGCNYLFEGKADGISNVSLELKMKTPISTDPLDSLMFLDLDGEKFRMLSNDYESGQFMNYSEDTGTSEVKVKDAGKVKTKVQPLILNDNYQLMSHRFNIPESLWVSIVNTQTIKLRIYLGKEGFDIQLNEAQTNRLKLFFQRSIDKRDANTPPLPEGYKKW